MPRPIPTCEARYPGWSHAKKDQNTKKLRTTNEFVVLANTWQTSTISIAAPLRVTKHGTSLQGFVFWVITTFITSHCRGRASAFCHPEASNLFTLRFLGVSTFAIARLSSLGDHSGSHLSWEPYCRLREGGLSGAVISRLTRESHVRTRRGVLITELTLL